jgi:hypothetical protein
MRPTVIAVVALLVAGCSGSAAKPEPVDVAAAVAIDGDDLSCRGAEVAAFSQDGYETTACTWRCALYEGRVLSWVALTFERCTGEGPKPCPATEWALVAEDVGPDGC